MIIVSQDEDTIINFDNVEILGIGNPLEGTEGKFKILANTISGEQYIIAKYKTEERAKEVRKEITKKYEKSMWKLGRNTLSFEDEFIYEMPKE